MSIWNDLSDLNPKEQMVRCDKSGMVRVEQRVGALGRWFKWIYPEHELGLALDNIMKKSLDLDKCFKVANFINKITLITEDNHEIVDKTKVFKKKIFGQFKEEFTLHSEGLDDASFDEMSCRLFSMAVEEKDYDFAIELLNNAKNPEAFQEVLREGFSKASKEMEFRIKLLERTQEPILQLTQTEIVNYLKNDLNKISFAYRLGVINPYFDGFNKYLISFLSRITDPEVLQKELEFLFKTALAGRRYNFIAKLLKKAGELEVSTKIIQKLKEFIGEEDLMMTFMTVQKEAKTFFIETLPHKKIVSFKSSLRAKRVFHFFADDISRDHLGAMRTYDEELSGNYSLRTFYDMEKMLRLQILDPDISDEEKDLLEGVRKNIQEGYELFSLNLDPNTITMKIKSLETGKRLIFPVNFLAHGVVYEIKREENGSCSFSIFNAGAGLREVMLARSGELLVRPHTISGMSIQDFSEDFISKVVNLTIDSHSKFIPFINSLINFRPGGPKIVRHDEDSPYVFSPQQAGTCAGASLYACLGTICPPEVFIRLRMKILAVSIDKLRRSITELDEVIEHPLQDHEIRDLRKNKEKVEKLLESIVDEKTKAEILRGKRIIPIEGSETRGFRIFKLFVEKFVNLISRI